MAIGPSQRPASVDVGLFAAVAAHCAPLRDTRKLVVSFEDRSLNQLLAGFGAGTTALRLDARDWRPGTARRPSLPCEPGRFDVAIACRVSREATSLDLGALLTQLHGAIRRGGRLVMLAHRSDFASAPLPQAAQAHMLRRLLLGAGFATPTFQVLSQHGAASDWFLAVAAPGESHAPTGYSVRIAAHAYECRPHSLSLAMRAPSTIEPSFM